MYDDEELAVVKDNVKTLNNAIYVFEEMLEAHQKMVENGDVDDDEQTETLEAEMETAIDVSKKLASGMVVTLRQNGMSVDFEDNSDDDDADDVGPSAFA